MYTISQLKDPNFKHYSTQINKIVRRSGVIVIVTSYISIITHKLIEYPQGTKVKIVIDKNYHTKRYLTEYHNLDGIQITKKEFYS